MCFVWISEQTAIISLYSINWLFFITETECVYSAVPTVSLYIIQVTWVLKSELYLHWQYFSLPIVTNKVFEPDLAKFSSNYATRHNSG